MKILKRLVAMTLATVISANTVVAQAQWVHHGTEWMYQDQAGKTLYGWQQTEPNNWYYLGSDGIMQTGFVKINNNFYYLNEKDHGVEGLMRTGWYQEPNNKNWYFFDTRPETLGAMYTGHWAWVDGYCYYFDATGKMAESTNIDGFQVDKDGRWTVDGVVQYQPGKGVSGKLVTTDNSSGSSTGGSSGSSHGSSGGSSGSSNGSHGSTSETKNTDTTVKNDDSTGDDKTEVTKPSIQDRSSKHDETDDGSDDISRYEWLMYVMDATEKEPSDNENLTNTFDDIDEDTEEGRYVLTAASLGILPDAEDTSVFDGDAPATREFAAVTTVNAMGYVADRELTKEDKRMFTDLSTLEYPVHDVISVKMEYMFPDEKDAFAPDENLSDDDAHEILDKIYEKRESWRHVGENSVHEVEYKDGFLKDELVEETQYRLEKINDNKYLITIPKNENTTLIKKDSLFMLPYILPGTESVAFRALNVKEDSLGKYYKITTEIPDIKDTCERIYIEGRADNISYKDIRPSKGVTVTYIDENGTQHVIDGNKEPDNNIIIDTLTEDDELNLLKSELVSNQKIATSSTINDAQLVRLVNDDVDIATHSILRKANTNDSDSIHENELTRDTIATNSEVQYTSYNISGSEINGIQPSMLSASLVSVQQDLKDIANLITPEINFSYKIPGTEITLYLSGSMDFDELSFLLDTDNNVYQVHSKYINQSKFSIWFNDGNNIINKDDADYTETVAEIFKKEMKKKKDLLKDDDSEELVMKLGEIPIYSTVALAYITINVKLTAVGTIDFIFESSNEAHLVIENDIPLFDFIPENNPPEVHVTFSLKLGLDFAPGFGLGFMVPSLIGPPIKMEQTLLIGHIMPYLKLETVTSIDGNWPICWDTKGSFAVSAWIDLEGPLKLFSSKNFGNNFWWEFPIGDVQLAHMEKASSEEEFKIVERCTREDGKKIKLIVKRLHNLKFPKGEPLEGATIKVKQGDKTIYGKTNKDGKYEGSFSTGTYTIEVSHEGYKTKTIENVVLDKNHGYDDSVVLEYEPEQTVTGIVRSKTTGKPLPDVEITVTHSGMDGEKFKNEGFDTITTNENGFYTVKLKYGESYKFTYSKDNYKTCSPMAYEVDYPFEIKDVEMSYEKVAKIRGYIKDGVNDTALTGVEYTINEIDNDDIRKKTLVAEGKAFDSGFYEHELEANKKYEIEFVKPRSTYYSATRTFTLLETDICMDIKILDKLSPYNNLAGIITDITTNEPLSDVNYTITQLKGGKTYSGKTDSYGNYSEILAFGYTYELAFDKFGYVNYSSTHTPVIKNHTINIQMQPEQAPKANIVGKVISEKTGKPLTGVVCNVLLDDAYIATTETTADGEYKVQVIPGKAYTLTFETEGYESSTLECTPSSDHETTEMADIRMEKSKEMKEVTFKVVDSWTGVALDDVYYTVKTFPPEETVVHTGVVDKKGEFTVTLVEDENYNIFVEKDGWNHRQYTLWASDKNQKIKIKMDSSTMRILKGKITDSYTGKEIPDVECEVYSRLLGYHYTVKANGNYTVKIPNDGLTYFVVFKKDGYKKVTEYYTIKNDSETEVIRNIQMQPKNPGMLKITGIVFSHTTNKPLSGVTCTVISDNEELSKFKTKSDGDYTVSVPGRKKYKILFEKEGYRSTTREYDFITREDDDKIYLCVEMSPDNTQLVAKYHVVFTWDDIIPWNYDECMYPEIYTETPTSGDPHIRAYGDEAATLEERDSHGNTLMKFLHFEDHMTAVLYGRVDDASIKYYVYGKKDQYSIHGKSLSNSNATVRIYESTEQLEKDPPTTLDGYKDAKLVKEFKVPKNAEGNVWHVFDWDYMNDEKPTKTNEVFDSNPHFLYAPDDDIRIVYTGEKQDSEQPDGQLYHVESMIFDEDDEQLRPATYWGSEQPDDYKNGKSVTRFSPDYSSCVTHINKRSGGKHKYYVQACAPVNEGLSNRNILIQVYKGKELLAEYPLNESVKGNTWHVFDWDTETQNLTFVNKIFNDNWYGNGNKPTA